MLARAGRGRGDPRHDRARRAADRRHGGVRRRARDARTIPSDATWTRAIDDARRDAADRGQPALGARRACAHALQPLPPSSVRMRAYEEAAAIADEDVAALRGDRSARAAPDPGDRRAHDAGRAGARAHALQRGLARLRRLGHGARADLRGARGGHPGARLGRRDASAQPGRVPHGVRARRARRAAHRDRRQHGRPPDAARPWSTCASSAATARPRTGDVANKIGTYLKALAAHDNGVPFYAALPSSTIDWTMSDGPREIPIEERVGTRSHARARAHDADGELRGRRGRRARQRGRESRASTSRRRGSSPGSSPSAASAPRRSREGLLRLVSRSAGGALTRS